MQKTDFNLQTASQPWNPKKITDVLNPGGISSVKNDSKFYCI